jgi:hypothetical protein
MASARSAWPDGAITVASSPSRIENKKTMSKKIVSPRQQPKKLFYFFQKNLMAHKNIRVNPG